MCAASRKRRLVVLVVMLVMQMVEGVVASDGCSISGKAGVCCDNSGVGPNCAYCPDQCTTGTKGASCSTTHSSCGSSIKNC